MSNPCNCSDHHCSGPFHLCIPLAVILDQLPALLHGALASMGEEQPLKKQKLAWEEPQGWEHHFQQQTVQLSVGSAKQGQVWEQQHDNPLICNVLLLPGGASSGSPSELQQGVRASACVLAERSEWFLALAGHQEDLPSGTRRDDGCLVLQAPIDVPADVLQMLVAAMHRGSLTLNSDNIVHMIKLADAMQAEDLVRGAADTLAQQAAQPSSPPALLAGALDLLLSLPGLVASADQLVAALLKQALSSDGNLASGWRLPKQVLVSASAAAEAMASGAFATSFKSHVRLLLLAALHEREDIMQHVDWQLVAPQEARAVVRILQAKGVPVPACAAWLGRAASDASGWQSDKVYCDIVEYCCDAPPAAQDGLLCFGDLFRLRFDQGLQLHKRFSHLSSVLKLAVCCVEASAAGMGWYNSMRTANYSITGVCMGWPADRSPLSDWEPHAVVANGKRKLTLGVEIHLFTPLSASLPSINRELLPPQGIVPLVRRFPG